MRLDATGSERTVWRRKRADGATGNRRGMAITRVAQRNNGQGRVLTKRPWNSPDSATTTLIEKALVEMKRGGVGRLHNSVVLVPRGIAEENADRIRGIVGVDCAVINKDRIVGAHRYVAPSVNGVTGGVSDSDAIGRKSGVGPGAIKLNASRPHDCATRIEAKAGG